MSIFLEGKKVREDELNEKIEVPFNDLDENGQKRMFSEDKDLFLADAIISAYRNIRESARKYAFEDCPNEILNEVIWELYRRQGKYTNRFIKEILYLLNIPRLKLEDSLQIEFATSNNGVLKEWLVTNPETSNDILNIALRCEFGEYWIKKSVLIDKIIMNPNFKLALDKKYYGDYMLQIEDRIKELKK